MLKIPQHLIEKYNRIQNQISRELGLKEFYKMLHDGSLELSDIPISSCVIGVDWEPENKRGCVIISHRDIITSTIQIASQSKSNFDKIVNSIAIGYNATIIKEK